ncbi:hypothetical protein O181_014482 [Austropuccinia psidii MF-1]|uniref:Tf2-1-like SH3-like domain-containing protein n=1 Tax=Austropuccinia psidii MF-1 TaxID=1389203 RepID=A0A9Q3C1Q6_9BASI|nr:hypothetical protein [Austropuccinia psidii MF-1]
MSTMLKKQNIHHKKFELLKPVSIWSGPWNSLSMDFITQFPLSNNFDSILVVVGIFSKMEIFIPAYGTITALELAQIFISHVFCKHGLQISIQVVKEELESAIRRFKKYADRNSPIPPDFQPGDKVWLASKNIKTTRPTKKLSERWLGPFEVIKKIASHAYHLKLPQQWKSVHPLFHVSLLEPVKESTIPNQHQLPPPPVLVEEQEEWEVAQVLDSKHKRGKLWYLAEWRDSAKTQKEQLGNQLPTLPTHQTLSRILTHCIQTSLVQIPQEFDFYGAW